MPNTQYNMHALQNKDDKALSSHKMTCLRNTKRHAIVNHSTKCACKATTTNISATSATALTSTATRKSATIMTPPFIAKHRARNKQATHRHPNAKATNNNKTKNSKKTNNISNKNTTSTHQKTAMETIDNDNVAESDDIDDGGAVVCDSESSLSESESDIDIKSNIIYVIALTQR
jgi:hypothetical protein